MTEFDSIATAVCFVLFLAGVAFIYYLSKMSQYNEASELRAKRRVEDVAYYLSKMEEQIDDAESQVHKKIDSGEVETRISLTLYEKKIGKALEQGRRRQRR